MAMPAGANSVYLGDPAQTYYSERRYAKQLAGKAKAVEYWCPSRKCAFCRSGRAGTGRLCTDP